MVHFDLFLPHSFSTEFTLLLVLHICDFIVEVVILGILASSFPHPSPELPYLSILALAGGIGGHILACLRIID